MTGLNQRIIKFLLIFFLLIANVSFCATTALQVDFLLSGMRDPLTDEPLNGGLVTFYDAGTVDLETIYVDRDKAATAANPVVLDAYGRASVFVDGVVDVSVTNASGDLVIAASGLDYRNSASSDFSITVFTQDVDASGYGLTNLREPVANGEAATKYYVDTEITGVNTAISNLSDSVDARTFLDLVDTPLSYSGHAQEFLVVGSSSTSVTYLDRDTVIASASILQLGDVIPTSFTGNAGKSLVVNTGETGVEFVSGSDGAPTGAIAMWLSAAAPSGWLVCNGQALDRTTYADLLAVVGTAYNDGTEGVSNFRLPDLRGMFLRGAGTQNSSYSGISQADGSAYAGLTAGSFKQDQFQAHDHNGAVINYPGTTFYGDGSGYIIFAAGTQGVKDEVSGAYGTARAGVETAPAHFTVNYIIKY